MRGMLKYEREPHFDTADCIPDFCLSQVFWVTLKNWSDKLKILEFVNLSQYVYFTNKFIISCNTWKPCCEVSDKDDIYKHLSDHYWQFAVFFQNVFSAFIQIYIYFISKEEYQSYLCFYPRSLFILQCDMENLQWYCL